MRQDTRWRVANGGDEEGEDQKQPSRNQRRGVASLTSARYISGGSVGSHPTWHVHPTAAPALHSAGVRGATVFALENFGGPSDPSRDRFASMGDNRRVIAKPPIGSVNNEPLVDLRELEVQIWREVFEHRQNADRIGPVGIAVL